MQNVKNDIKYMYEKMSLNVKRRYTCEKLYCDTECKIIGFTCVAPIIVTPIISHLSQYYFSHL